MSQVQILNLPPPVTSHLPISCSSLPSPEGRGRKGKGGKEDGDISQYELNAPFKEQCWVFQNGHHNSYTFSLHMKR